MLRYAVCVCVCGAVRVVHSNIKCVCFCLQMMEQLTDHHYEVLTVPEEAAANCVYVKGPSNRDFLLHRPAEECPDSVSVSTAEDSGFLLQASKRASSLLNQGIMAALSFCP